MDVRESNQFVWHSDVQKYWIQYASYYFSDFIDQWIDYVKTLTANNAQFARTYSPSTYERLKQVSLSHYSSLLLLFNNDRPATDERQQLTMELILLGFSPIEIIDITHFIYRYWIEKIELSDKGIEDEAFSLEMKAFVEQRFYDDQVEMFMNAELIRESYYKYPLSKNTTAMTWAEWRQHELDLITTLPGVRLVFLMRPKENSKFTIELSAGLLSSEIRENALKRTDLPSMQPDSVNGQALVSIAAREYRVISSPDFPTRPGSQIWADTAVSLGVHSFLAIPLRLSTTGQMMVIMIYGIYEYQFETKRMHEFAEFTQKKWEENWLTQLSISNPPSLATPDTLFFLGHYNLRSTVR